MSFLKAARLLAGFSLAVFCSMPAVAAPDRVSMAQFESYAKRCAPSVGERLIKGLVKRESALRQFAIGIDDRSTHRLSRQANNYAEAQVAAALLDKAGVTYSVGIGQIHINNVRAFGLTLREAFDVCKNLELAAKILGDCFNRSGKRSADEQQRIRLALSCYNSGNFSTGFRNGYVDGVVKLALSE
jgi:type IV secretion system protein VirB1